jgi:hypothetical protein
VYFCPFNQENNNHKILLKVNKAQETIFRKIGSLLDSNSRKQKIKRIKYIHQNLRYYETIDQIHFMVVKIESYVWEKNCNI